MTGPLVGVVDSAGHEIPAVVVDSIDDPAIAAFVGSKDRALRLDRPLERWGGGSPGARQGVFIAESDRVIERAVRAGFVPIELLIHADRNRPLPFELSSATRCMALAADVARELSGADHRSGSLALFERPPIPRVGEALRSLPSELQRARVVVLAEVTNPVNMGVMARTAAALGIDAVLLDRRSVDPYYRRCSRVAMGEVFALRIGRGGTATEVIDELKANEFQVVGLTPEEGAVDITDLGLGSVDRVAVVLGAEGPGLQPEAMEACSVTSRIPISSAVDSLNVAAAAAIAMWELSR